MSNNFVDTDGRLKTVSEVDPLPVLLVEDDTLPNTTIVCLLMELIEQVKITNKHLSEINGEELEVE